MSDNIRNRVRKLLALAGDQGATDNERAVAMQKAERLIEEHNIELGESDAFDPNDVEVFEAPVFASGLKATFHLRVGAAVASLYDCRHLVGRQSGSHSFIGMKHQIEASEETFLWVVAQIEDLYRQALKSQGGTLTKKQRAELRASFKDAAAIRVGQRVAEILRERNSARNRNALVVVNAAKEKIEEMLSDRKTIKSKEHKLGFGSQAGYMAGDRVRIQKEVRQ